MWISLGVVAQGSCRFFVLESDQCWAGQGSVHCEDWLSVLMTSDRAR